MSEILGYAVRCVVNDKTEDVGKYYMRKDGNMSLRATTVKSAEIFKSQERANEFCRKAIKAFNGKGYFAVVVVLDSATSAKGGKFMKW